MKALSTLETIIKSLSTSETNQFRKYLAYKNKKRAIRLLETILSYHKSKQSVDIEIFLQRKKFGQKTTRACNELLALFNKFCADNLLEDDTFTEAFDLLAGAKAMIKKGLIKEAVRNYELAEQKAAKNNMYYIQFECIAKTWLWSRSLYPKKAETILEEFHSAQTDMLKKMGDFSEGQYLAHKTLHLLQKGVWSLNDEEKKFLINTQQRTQQIILDDSLNVQAKLQFYSLLSLLHQYNFPGNLEKSLLYNQKTLTLAKNLFDQGQRGKISMVLSCIYNVHLILVFTDQKEEILTNRTVFRTLMNSEPDHSIRIEFYSLSLELLTLLSLKQYDQSIMDQTEVFLTNYDNQKEDIPYENYWHICFPCFEVYLSNGELEKAETYANRLLDKELRATILVDFKLNGRLANLLIQYELGNLEFIANEGENIRRLYSNYLENNPCCRLVIKYLMKLSTVLHFNDRKPIYEKFKLDIEKELSFFYNKRIFHFTIFPDWIDAKLKKLPSINSLYDPSGKV